MVSARNNINNKTTTDHECIDIFIENGNGRKIQNTEMNKFKYNKDKFNNESSVIIDTSFEQGRNKEVAVV